MEVVLTPSQTSAYSIITQNLNVAKIILLSGSAGTGKTTLTKRIANFFLMSKLRICGIAPTHKAKRVLQTILNKKILFPIHAYTVASVLGKMRNHSYIGTKSYSKANDKKFETYDLFILDEVSMVSDSDLRVILEYTKKTNKLLLIIGDPYQIPCPSAQYVIHEDHVMRADSFVFRDQSILHVSLNEIVRQNAESPILKLATFVRDNINEGFSIEESGEKFLTKAEAYDKCKTMNFQESKIITYTNQSVKSHNMEIRRVLGYTQDFVKGDILTGYVNIGFPELIIENGRDYVVESIITTDSYKILDSNLYGTILTVYPVDQGLSSPRTKLFVVNIEAEQNYDMIQELIRRAEKNNARDSRKQDFESYIELKYKMIFMEDIYKYDDKIYTESTFRETHPLLFVRLDEVLCNRKIISTNLFEKLNEMYPTLVNDRIIDNKNIGDSEMFADRFKVVEKDIFYGYAITAHKSQGSTFENVVVDEDDFRKIADRMNYKYNKMERRVREKNQLRYVAYTRPKKNLYIICEGTSSNGFIDK
jgi:hypothetical protein